MIKLSLNLCIVLIVTFMLIVPTILYIALKRHNKALKICFSVLAIIYFAFLTLGFFGSVSIDNGFVTAKYDFSGIWFHAHKFLLCDASLGNILVNIFIFFPIGFIVFAFSKKHKFLKTILLAFCLSLSVEFLQFALPVKRIVELTDVLYNTISGIISGLYLVILEKIFKLNHTQDKKNDETIKEKKLIN